MHFTLWWSVISAALFLEVRCGRQHVIYYAENKCHGGRDDSISFHLAPSGWNSAAIIRATQLFSYSGSYPFNCNITVSVPNADDGHVLLTVRKVSFPTKAECANYIEMYENNRIDKFCTMNDLLGNKTDFTDIRTDSMTFLYHTDYYNGMTHNLFDDFFSTAFEVLATAYTKAPCEEELSFPCKNGRCISRELLLDGYDNCGDGSDESVVPSPVPSRAASRLTLWEIIVICIAVLLLKAAILAIFSWVRQKVVTRIRTHTAASRSAAGPQVYLQQTYAPFPPQPQALQDQYGGIENPIYGVPPPQCQRGA